MTFAHRLNLLFIVFMLLGCVIQFLIFDRNFLEHTNFMMLEISRQTAKSNSEQIEKRFTAICSILDRISADEKIMDDKDILDEIKRVTPDIDTLMFLNEKGEITAIAGEQGIVTEADLQKTKYLEETKQRKEYISNVHTTESGQRVIYISVPIIRNGDVVGAVVGVIKLSGERMNAFFAGSVSNAEQYTIILDANGEVIYGSDSGQMEAKGKLVDSLRGESGSKMTRDAAGEKRFTGYSKIGRTGWIILVNTPVADIIKNRDLVVYEMIMLFILENIIFITIAMYIIKRYTKSMNQLLEAFNSLKKGNYKKLKESDYKEEFRKIVEIYNAVLKKITVERSTLSKEANIDELTGAYNRRAFDKVLQIIDGEVQEKATKEVGFLLLDLDHFKEHNDSQGHLFGDKILHDAVAIMKETVGERNVFRFGGDEFFLYISHYDAPANVCNLGRQILEGISAIRTALGHEVLVSASIGIAFCTPGDTSRENLIKKADLAMYQVKENGKSNILVYHE